jgi:hypothetical protein
MCVHPWDYFSSIGNNDWDYFSSIGNNEDIIMSI